MTALPDICVSSGTSVTVEPRILRNDFGDGYSQRTPDGLNTIRRVWRAQWNNILQSEANTLVAFFKSLKGVLVFTWTGPADSAGQFICKTWSMTPITGGFANLTAEFDEEFDL